MVFRGLFSTFGLFEIWFLDGKIGALDRLDVVFRLLFYGFVVSGGVFLRLVR